MNGNFFQLTGPGGRAPTLTASGAPSTFFFNLQGFPAKLGNDWIYADRIRFRLAGPIHLQTNQAGLTPTPALMPNRQQLANAIRQVRVYSPLLGELAPRAANYGTFLQNHDSWFDDDFAAHSLEQIRNTITLAATTQQVFIDFEISFMRDYLLSNDDTTPLLALLEGGQLEIDLAPTLALPVGSDNVKWVLDTTANAWTCTATMDYHHDSQLFIHSPAQKRLYQQVLSAPTFELQNVGAPQGLDGVASGSRLAIMSWLGAGYIAGSDTPILIDPCQFYTNLAALSGVNFAAAGMNRIDIPWRDQRSINDVQAWMAAFLRDVKRRPTRQQSGFDFNSATAGIGNSVATIYKLSDLSGFPNQEDICPTDNLAIFGDPMLNLVNTFFPMIWPDRNGSKIADMQMVDGTLDFSADFATPPSSRAYRFRTDEICQFTETKVREIMAALKTPHVQDGGDYVLVPKYDGSRMGSATTAAFLPQKIVHKAALG